MPKKPAKAFPVDMNRRAAAVVALATGEAEAAPEKNPVAASSGRLGGLKGGKARAAKLSPERRGAIARLAAEKRHRKDQS